MKVCILTSAHSAFDDRIFLKQARGLARAGYDVTLVAPHERDEVVDGVVIKSVPKPHGRIGRFSLNLWRIYREAARLKAAVCHLHDPDLIVVGILLKLTTHSKVVFDAHEDYPLVALRRAWIWKPLRPFARAAVWWAFRLTLPFFDAIVAATESIASSLPNRTRIVVKNYADLRVGAFGNNHQLNLLVYAGLVSPERGISEFLEAFRKINQTMAVRLRLAGAEDGRLRQEILQQCPPGTLEIKGRLKQQEALEFIAPGTLGLVLDLPLPGSDGLPTKLFEFMALGLPVVAADLPTIRRIVEDAQCGIIVDFRNPSDVAGKIVDLLNDPDRISAMRQRGFEAYLKSYQWNTQEVQLLDLYRKLV
jgi:glycosyltransferase involved in cell wall biosynthesis